MEPASPERDAAGGADDVERLFDRLASLRMTDAAIGQGDTAPEFCLPSTAGDLVMLQDLLADGPVVISFIRGEWCPVCRSEVDGLREIYPRIRAAGAALAVITPEGGSPSAKLRRDKGLPFDLLCDLDLGVSTTYGLVFRVPEDMRDGFLAKDRNLPVRHGHDGWLLPVPATYVVGTDGIVRVAHVNVDYRQRLAPEAILDALAVLRL